MGRSSGKNICRYQCKKKVFLGKPDGRRIAGRPKLRWSYYTENNLKSMGV